MRRTTQAEGLSARRTGCERPRRARASVVVKAWLVAGLLGALPSGAALAQGTAVPVPNEASVVVEEAQLEDPPFEREYRLLLTPAYELETVAVLGVTLNKAAHDLYFRQLDPHMPRYVGGAVGQLWSLFWTYTFTLWPHEFGHWSRAPQVHSAFIFHDVGFPIPYTTVKMPATATPLDEAVLSVGGFEVNSLIARNIQQDFHARGYAYVDSLSHALVQKLFFPVYATLIAPADPDKADTWLRTRGDPVQFVLPTFRVHTGLEPVRADGSVEPGLSSYYNETLLMSVLWPLLDPLVYQAFANTFEDRTRAVKPWILIGDETWGWTPGTTFNPSPLGYELYLDNYLHLGGRLVVASLKYGRPAQNLAMRVAMPEFAQLDALSVGGIVEGWVQDVYGPGISVSVTSRYTLSDGFDVHLRGGWKSDGYALGRRTDDSFEGFVGLGYRFDPR